jgi:hypothetical protein
LQLLDQLLDPTPNFVADRPGNRNALAGRVIEHSW